jgi:hypothetical protein
VDHKSVFDSIDRFVSVFHSYVRDVSSLSIGQDMEYYRKILYFTLLEALSKARYPTCRPSKAFSRFIVGSCNWVEGNRVSLPHLVAALERTRAPEFLQVRGVAFAELQQWGSGGPISIERDLDKHVVQQSWPKGSDGKPQKIPELNIYWKALQHRSLLYSYRSKLTHESREVTCSFEDGSERCPFYESVENPSIPHADWHIVYPSTFLQTQCRSGIDGLKDWLQANSKDPYQQFSFGRFLIDKINDPTVKIVNPFG